MYVGSSAFNLLRNNLNLPESKGKRQRKSISFILRVLRAGERDAQTERERKRKGRGLMGCRVVASWDAGTPIMHAERLHLINYPTGLSRLLPYADNDASPAIPLLRLMSPLAVLKRRCHKKKVSVQSRPGEEKHKKTNKNKNSRIVNYLLVVVFPITFFNERNGHAVKQEWWGRNYVLHIGQSVDFLAAETVSIVQM